MYSSSFKLLAVTDSVALTEGPQRKRQVSEADRDDAGEKDGAGDTEKVNTKRAAGKTSGKTSGWKAPTLSMGLDSDVFTMEADTQTQRDMAKTRKTRGSKADQSNNTDKVASKKTEELTEAEVGKIIKQEVLDQAFEEKRNDKEEKKSAQPEGVVSPQGSQRSRDEMIQEMREKISTLMSDLESSQKMLQDLSASQQHDDDVSKDVTNQKSQSDNAGHGNITTPDMMSSLQQITTRSGKSGSSCSSSTRHKRRKLTEIAKPQATASVPAPAPNTPKAKKGKSAFSVPKSATATEDPEPLSQRSTRSQSHRNLSQSPRASATQQRMQTRASSSQDRDSQPFEGMDLDLAVASQSQGSTVPSAIIRHQDDSEPLDFEE